MLARDWWDRPVPQVGGNSPYILGFNEPDLSSQANLTPQRAAVLWRRIEQAYPHRLLVSPAVSCGDLYWLVRFRSAYRELYGTWPRFDVLAACCAHRVGALAIGDLAVWVGVSAAHRGAAFDACRYIIDEVKQRVPIWKREHYREGDADWLHPVADGP